MRKALTQYMTLNKVLEETTRRYTLYVFGYLKIWFDDQRQKGMLKQGKKRQSLNLILLRTS